jgi:hypothetical protein
MSFIIVLLMVILVHVAGCAAPNYLPVPAADITDAQYRGLSPSLPGRAVVRDQHLGQLQAEMRYLEERLLRAEQNRLDACRAPEASQVDSAAYQRCQIRDQIFQQLSAEAATARRRYLRAVAGQG